jgi:Nuclear condensing complex subunits, C-term domain
MCLFHKPFALQYKDLFLQFYLEASEDTRLIALKVIFDFLVLFRQSPKSTDEIHHSRLSSGGDWIATSDPFYNCLEAITSALYNPAPELQALAVEGFAKLYLLKILQDDQVTTYSYIDAASTSLFFIYLCF